jgi:hypothetical protein
LLRCSTDCLDPVTIVGHRPAEAEEGARRNFVKTLIAAAAAAALAVSPTVAAAQSARVEVAPAAEQAEGEQIRGGFLLPLAIIVAVIITVYFLTDDDDAAVPLTP